MRVPVEKIVALKPTQAQIERIEKKLEAPLPQGKTILDIKKIGKLPHGASGVLYLEELPDRSSEAKLRIYPSKPSFFEFTPERSIGVYAGLGFGRLAGEVYNLEFTQGLFRLGPAKLEAKAGVLHSAIMGTDGYLLVGARVIF